MSKALFTDFVTFGAGAADGAVETIDVPLPDWDDGKYVVAVKVDQPLSAGVAVSLFDRVALETPGQGYRTELAQVGGAAFMTVAAGAFTAKVAEGWLVGTSPAQASFTLQAVASNTGGRVWIAVYPLGSE